MAGKRPAIMERPEYLLAAGSQIGKQQTNMDIVAVNVMKPDHIRVIFPDPVQKMLGRRFGTKAMVIQQAASQAMDFIIQCRADPDRGNILTIGLFAAEGEHTFVTLRHQFPALFRRDSSGTAKTSNGVDEQVLHELASIVLIFSICARPSCPQHRYRTGSA